MVSVRGKIGQSQNHLTSIQGIEAIDDIKKKIKSQREDLLDLLRQDRSYGQDCITKAVTDLDRKIHHKLEAIKQNMFDIFNEYPETGQRSSRAKQHSIPQTIDQKEFVSLNMDVEKIKIQLKEIQRC